MGGNSKIWMSKLFPNIDGIGGTICQKQWLPPRLITVGGSRPQIHLGHDRFGKWCWDESLVSLLTNCCLLISMSIRSRSIIHRWQWNIITTKCNTSRCTPRRGVILSGIVVVVILIATYLITSFVVLVTTSSIILALSTTIVLIARTRPRIATARTNYDDKCLMHINVCIVVKV